MWELQENVGIYGKILDFQENVGSYRSAGVSWKMQGVLEKCRDLQKNVGIYRKMKKYLEQIYELLGIQEFQAKNMNFRKLQEFKKKI